MTQEQANRLRELALEEGLPEIDIFAHPLGGYVQRGIAFGQPKSDRWHFAVRCPDGDAKGKLVCVLAKAGATRENTDMIRDRDTYRITRIG